MLKAFFTWLGLSLCTLGYFVTTNNPVLAEARLALGEETLSEGVSFRTPSFLAQVTSDGTVNTQVNDDGNTAEIIGGETRGDNLFHSFKDFSVKTGNEAFFNNADSISNIFSRVTGGNVSDIDGAIRANGSANLFLINPAGILFGENASLNIGGSFYGSSASSILFEDGEFNAVDLDTLLTVNAPIGFSFRDQPGDITNNSVANDGNGLAVNSGKNISLLGGDVSFNGGRVTAPGGGVNLGGLTAAGTVSFTEDGSLSFSENVIRGDVSLANSSSVAVLAGGGGSIFVNAKNLGLTSSSLIGAGINSNLGLVKAQAGDIVINTTESVALDSSLVFNAIAQSVTGDGGAINITTPNLALTNGGVISTSTLGQGNAGNITIKAIDGISIADNSNIQAQGFASATGNAGAINIATSSLSLLDNDNSGIVARNFGTGNAGDITIDAIGDIVIKSTRPSRISGGGLIATAVSNPIATSGRVNIKADSLSLDGISSIFTDQIGSNDGNNEVISGTGKAGDINLALTDSLAVTNGANISSDTGGRGNAGNITIRAGENVTLDGFRTSLSATGISSDVKFAGIGNGGNVNIQARNLSLKGGAAISTQTFGIGNAGKIEVNILDSVMIASGFTTDENGKTIPTTSSGLFSSTIETAIGNGGAINVSTSKLQLSNVAAISASSRGSGDGGSIIINADTINLDSGSQILATAFDRGNAGNIKVNASDRVNIFGKDITYLDRAGSSKTPKPTFEPFETQSPESGIFTNVQSTARANGGNISLTAGNLSLAKGGSISAEATNNANGGNLTIDSNFIVAFPKGNNDIIANAAQGRGGNISIVSEGIFGIEERPLNNSTNDINASSEFDLDGSVNINTSDINPVQGATELPSNIVELEQTAEQTCSADREGKANNGLAIAGRGGVHPAPDLPLSSERINNENPAQASIPEPLETSQGKIQPARGIKVAKSGKIVLTAYPTDNTGERIPEIKPNCN